MSENESGQPMPGDVVNGYMLGNDNKWHHIGPQDPTVPVAQPKGKSKAPLLYIGGGLVALLIVVSGVVAAVNPAPEPAPAPAPAETVTETADPTPTPEPTTIEDDSEYILIQSMLDKALADTNTDMDMLCLAYQVDQAKTLSKFTRIAVNQFDVDYGTAQTATEDWFTKKCGT